MAKRARDPQDDGSSQLTPSEAPRRKRSKVIGSLPPSATTSPIKQTASKKASSTRTTQKKSKKAVKGSVLLPTKRKRVNGKLNKLALPKPLSSATKRGPASGSTRPDVNRRGNKINNGWGTGGFESAAADALLVGHMRDDTGQTANATPSASGKSQKTIQGVEMWITRKASYAAYLKAGISAFVHKGNHTLIMRALGAAIPVCLSLAMAIREGLPCGEDGTSLDVRTDSVDVNDEIVPADDSEGENEDIQYQVRTKSTVECILQLKKSVRKRMLVSANGVNASATLGAKTMGVRPGRGRGKPVRGGLGRHQGRGRGRGS